MAKPSARDRVLDAYQDVLIEHGPSSVTLEAVAAEAGVSKGGLLYHFGSKDALLEGLIGRLYELTEEDLATARESPEGVASYYIRSSMAEVLRDERLYRTTLAAIRMMHLPRVSDAMREATAKWRALLLEHTPDALTADLIATVGDGLYLRAALGETETPLLDDLPTTLRRLGL
ncbi:TetR/AcrR family transcriptional regulator [Amycolatopsis nigrescens]|uniref:TetR/AcrR family transcriptional regulator n=1 Tax=Amycolatopsis nigrescens TaxID=381445 RepID=UPI00036FB216|nr:TetR/AcrR family transcriptional regulator [Amycolatopsis nigrescens]